MNNKGFTLIELLAVILILSLLALIANTSVTKIVRDSKTDLYDSQLQIIKLAAESWGSENIDKLPDNGECKYLTLGDLKKYGLLDSNIKNPKNDKEFSDDLNIKIVAAETKYGKTKITYEVDSKDISSCSIAIPPICTLVSGTKNTTGAKYSCEVKEGTNYNFYVLSNNDDGTTNLIMERNICEDGTVATSNNVCLVAYNSDGDSAGVGPVTAMSYLNKATSSWENIPNLNLTYDDEGGNFTGFALNGKARLPYYSEVSDYDYINKTNEYLYDYLDLSNFALTNPMSGIYGYWTLSSFSSTSLGAWCVLYLGTVRYDSVIGGYMTPGVGVRPVITLRL